MWSCVFFFQAEDGIRDVAVTGVQTCALPIFGRAIRNWYADELVGDAQALLARECARALAGHPALWGWDLGNENSNCCVPPTREAGKRWLDRIAGAIRSVDPSCHLTLGLHMEDLEEGREIGPAEAAAVGGILSM